MFTFAYQIKSSQKSGLTQSSSKTYKLMQKFQTSFKINQDNQVPKYKARRKRS